MKVPFLIVFAVAVLGTQLVQGLRCWKCNNAKSKNDCIKSGRSEQCRTHQKMACQTEVRFHAGWGGKPMITTGCKERNACSNNQAQNPRAAWSPSQCNPKKVNSVCRCCCVGRHCNRENLLCETSNSEDNEGVNTTKSTASDEERTKASPTPTESTPAPNTTEIPPIVITVDIKEADYKELYCEDLGYIRHGLITCTNEKYGIGTVCGFSCSDGFELEYNYVTECLEHDGKAVWTHPKPQCRPKPACPPVAKTDVVVIMDSSGSISKADWTIMKNFVSDLIGQFEVSPDQAQFAVFRFNRKVDQKSTITFDDFRRDRDGLRKAVTSLPKKGSGTRLGRALKYAQDNVLAHGNRDDAKDLIIVITDGKTKDMPLLSQVSQELRDNGVKIIALGVPDDGEEEFVDQLVEMTGSSDHVFLVHDVANDFSEKLIPFVSEKICKLAE